MDSIKELDYHQLERTAETLKAIAHPLRIAILGLLENGSKLSVSQIHENLDIEQATASHHLGILKGKGILNSKRDGKNTFYSINKDNFSSIMCCFKRCANPSK